MEAFDDFFWAGAMMEDEAIRADAGGAVAGADLFFPEDGDALGSEGLAEVGLWGSVIAKRAEELGPVGGVGEREEERWEEESEEGAHGEKDVYGC